MDERDIIAEVSAGPLRRGVAVGALIGLGVVFGKIAPDPTLSGLWQGLSALGAGGALLLGGLSWKATAGRIWLTQEGLFDHTGAALARIEDIEAVDGGAFSLKPSNGFAVTLKTTGPRYWAPGMYWRWGKRIGIGGVPSGRAARFMAEQLSQRLPKRSR